jgi:IS1 family transposase
MAANAWIYTSYTNEGDGTIDYVLNGSNVWLPASATTPNPAYPALDANGDPITDATDPDFEPQYVSKANPAYDDGVSGTINKFLPLVTADLEANFNSSLILLDAVTSVEAARSQQGAYQQLYVDRDVRMERVTVEVTYPAV